ncbi:MAG: hypothetical protein ACRELG_23775, partial [Gemmataceae bacterium]
VSTIKRARMLDLVYKRCFGDMLRYPIRSRSAREDLCHLAGTRTSLSLLKSLDSTPSAVE